jgi:hypothetical protein
MRSVPPERVGDTGVGALWGASAVACGVDAEAVAGWAVAAVGWAVAGGAGAWAAAGGAAPGVGAGCCGAAGPTPQAEASVAPVPITMTASAARRLRRAPFSARFTSSSPFARNQDSAPLTFDCAAEDAAGEVAL